MKVSATSFFLASSLFFVNQVYAEPVAVTFSTTVARTTLLELYTSEGCSSCPPADRWLSALKRDPRLWKELFPVAFHVDYWNYLGWKDVFSKKEFSGRQRRYAALGYTNTVYTPGFFQNGREWRGWFNKPVVRKAPTINTGKLSVTVEPSHIRATFSPVVALNDTHLNIAILGADRTTRVRAGENRDRQLQHDFVVLAYTQHKSVDNRWRISDESFLRELNNGDAVVLWVTEGRDPTPVQTTGGWLRKE